MSDKKLSGDGVYWSLSMWAVCVGFAVGMDMYGFAAGIFSFGVFGLLRDIAVTINKNSEDEE